MSTVSEKLLVLACSHFKREQGSLRLEHDIFAELGIDSVQSLELLSEVEARFDIEVPDYELRGVTTFAALARVIEKRVGGNS